MKETLRIALESPRQPGVVALIEELDAYQKPLYPAESHHGIDIDALAKDNVLFAVARCPGGEAVACGAIVLEAGYGELKRMFTRPSYRGQGIAGQLLRLLENAAKALGCTSFALETGYLQPQAIALYERFGYARRGPFGDYLDDTNSVFMAKSTGCAVPMAGRPPTERRPQAKIAATAWSPAVPIELPKEAHKQAIASIERYFQENMEERIGNIAAGALLNFFLEEVGPTVYNKAVADVQENLQRRVSELDLEIHEDEFRYWRKHGGPTRSGR